jgi:predicted DNA-binding protein (MmcQ/YjbR family)
MIDEEKFRDLAMSLDHVEEKPHFKATSFRVNNKIFVSLEVEKKKACFKFSKEEQEIFCQLDKAIYPVDNHWGKSGWTYMDIENIREELLLEAMDSAYKEVLKT